jgi:uncharacterized membrane protein YqhA
MSDPRNPDQPTKLSPLNNLIFMSRWLQLPLYLGLILAQCVYVPLLSGTDRAEIPPTLFF